MKRKTLTTAALLIAAMALPTMAQDNDAPAVHVERRVVIVQTNDGDAADAQEQQVVIVQRGEGDTVEGDMTAVVRVVGQAGVDGADGADAIRDEVIRTIMMDEDGNVIEVEGDFTGEWIQGEPMLVELDEMGLPGAMFLQGGQGDEDIQVFLRRLGHPDVLSHGPVNPPMVEATYLGINCEPLDFDAAALLLVDEGTGLDVTFVAQDSPAAAAGIEIGDVLLAMDNQILINAEQFAVLIRTHDAGQTVTLLTVRDGEEFELETELGTNTVPQLGPGGHNLNQFWNVERGQNHQLHFAPDDIPGVLDVAEGKVEMLQALLLEQMQNMPDPAMLEQQAQLMQEQMLIHEESLRALMVQLHGHHGQLDQLHEIEMKMDADHDTAASLSWSDGEHSISISGDNEGNQTLNVTDADGNEIYDGPMPEGDAFDALPEEVKPKVEELLDMAGITVDLAPAQPEQPDAPDAQGADF